MSYQHAFEGLSPEVQNNVWRYVATLALNIVEGIDKIEIQNESSSGTIYPPVLPHQLVQMRSFEFNNIVLEHIERIADEEYLEKIQEDHRLLLQADREETTLKDAILAYASKDSMSFDGGRECMGNIRFQQIKKFCGGLATIFPGTATVESDFSIVNYKKDQYRAALSNFSLEGILHAKQAEALATMG